MDVTTIGAVLLSGLTVAATMTRWWRLPPRTPASRVLLIAARETPKPDRAALWKRQET